MSRDKILLQHMLDAAKEALSFASGKTRTDLETNRMLVLSLVKDIEIIGEAASRVSVSGGRAILNLWHRCEIQRY